MGIHSFIQKAFIRQRFHARTVSDSGETEAKEEKVKNADSADQYGEISKIFELKEKGIITEEEFNMKKKQLLGL